MNPSDLMASRTRRTEACTQAFQLRRRKCRETTIATTSCTSDSATSFRFKYLPSQVSPLMEFSPTPPKSSKNAVISNGTPSNFTFNSALTAGLLNPISAPPKPRSSATLSEMMANESSTSVPPLQERQALILRRMGDRSSGDRFNDEASSDVKLTLRSEDGVSVSLHVHREILVDHSRFFALKISDKWSRQQRSLPHVVEIADCEDVEVYVETLRLMYCEDMKKRLIKSDVSFVLNILKVAAAIGFDAGVASCLEYLEAVPWAEKEEEKVASLLSDLRLEEVHAREVLKRVSTETSNEEILLKLLHEVLDGKDEKARREMKSMISRLLIENPLKNSLYSASNRCLQALRNAFFQAANSDFTQASQISRQADNLHWILDILIDMQMAEDFLKTWASEFELSQAHSKVPTIHRYEISRLTARFFVGIGKRQMLASNESRCLLIRTWLVPFYDDFGWTRRAFRGLDRNSIEEGLSSTILTLPFDLQREILLYWVHRFLNSADECPNLQKGFEVWCHRAFSRQSSRLGSREEGHVVASELDANEVHDFV